MYGMYIINGVYGPEQKSLAGNTSSNPQVSALIPRPASHGMETMYINIYLYLYDFSIISIYTIRSICDHDTSWVAIQHFDMTIEKGLYLGH